MLEEEPEGEIMIKNYIQKHLQEDQNGIKSNHIMIISRIFRNILLHLTVRQSKEGIKGDDHEVRGKEGNYVK